MPICSPPFPYTNTHIDDNRKYYIFSKIRLTLPVSLTFIIYWIILTKLIRPSLPHPWHPTDLVSPLSLPDRRPLAPFTIQTHSRKLQHKYIAFPSSSLKRPRFPLRSPERSYPGLFPSPHAISLSIHVSNAIWRANAFVRFCCVARGSATRRQRNWK